MKLATWNVNSLKVRLPQVLQWLADSPVDVLCLQETKLTDDKFPQAELEAAGYQSQWFGQKTYNGVALLTRSPSTDIVKNIPGFEDEQARVIAGTVNDPEGDREVPSVLLTPISIFRDNVKDVVDDEFVTAEELCTGEFAEACTELGIE